MILVTGATGQVGSAAVHELAKMGAPVRALVRDPTTARPLGDVEIAVGDFDSPATLDAATEGVSTIVLVSPAVPEQELAVVRSAAQAGVRHVVKATSKASADSPIARRRGQAEIEAGIRASGLDHTFLRSNAYMQNVLGLAPAIAASDGFGSAAGEGRIGMVDARDVGAVAARVAADPAAHAGQTYHLTGPALITYGDIATWLSDLLGRRITYRTTTPEEGRHMMMQAGVPDAIATMNAQAFSLIAQGDAEWLTDDVPIILGRPAHSFETFARDHAASFSPRS